MSPYNNTVMTSAIGCHRLIPEKARTWFVQYKSSAHGCVHAAVFKHCASSSDVDITATIKGGDHEWVITEVVSAEDESEWKRMVERLDKLGQWVVYSPTHVLLQLRFPNPNLKITYPSFQFKLQLSIRVV